MLLQSVPLTVLNAIVGGRIRFRVWMAILGAALALVPLVVYSVYHPWLNLADASPECLMMVSFQALMGAGIAHLLHPLLEGARRRIDAAITAPARRRLESERKPLVLDNVR